MEGQRDTKSQHVKWRDLRQKSVKPDLREGNGSEKTKKCSLATLSPVFPSNRVKAISYQVITGQEAETYVASQLVKAAPFLPN